MSNFVGSSLKNITSLTAGSLSGLYFTFEVNGFDVGDFGVVRFDLKERYNELFELNLLVVTESGRQLDFYSLLDRRGVFKVWEGGALQRSVSGIISVIEQGDSGHHRTFYRIVLRPRAYRLTLRQNSRIFQRQSVEGILSTLLKENHLPHYACAFQHSHQVREYCVQYRETDFEFLCRLLGEEGIFFYVKEEDGQDVLMFHDDYSSLSIQDTELAVYNPHRTAGLQEKIVHSFRYGHQLKPHYADLRDYTFKNPTWVAAFSEERKDELREKDDYLREYTHYDYPGRYKQGEQGQFFTRTRLDSLRRDANRGEGESNDIRLCLGTLFRLSAHPTAGFNRLWQLTWVHHHGEQSQALEEESLGEGSVLHSKFGFIPHKQNYRANFPQKPQISGPQTAIVVGPKGEEIFTDNQGRVKVQFHWDREGKQDDHSSCWIRVASPWAGQTWGMLSLPRVGQEVIVSFQEGDPDQPIITGRVYNALQVPPGHLPQSKTQMFLKSKTYKGEGYNSIMFDDATHNELFQEHAERDMETKVKHDQRNHIQNDRTLKVDGSQSTTIGKGRTTQITTGNEIKTVLAGSNLETISLLKSTTAKEIFKYAQDRIELEVGKQTSITMDNEKILLRFGKNTILMNEEGIWLDGVHIGINEKNPQHQNAEVEFDESELQPDCLRFYQETMVEEKV